jgi:hypothetical protein
MEGSGAASATVTSEVAIVRGTDTSNEKDDSEDSWGSSE